MLYYTRISQVNSWQLSLEYLKHYADPVSASNVLIAQDNTESVVTSQGAFHHGQVPQMGRELGSIQLVVPVSKLAGLEGISSTHHPDRSWLNADA